jgi:hypothetical protein
MGSFRPYTTYKAFGGVLTAMSLPNVIGFFIWGTPTTPKPSLTVVAASLIVGSVGVCIFVASDRQIKKMKSGEPNSARNPTEIRVDSRGVFIFAGAMLLLLFFVALRARYSGG